MILLQRLFALFCLSLLMTACGGGGDDGPPRPVADAGADQTVEYGTTVTLDGSGSSAPEGGPLSYTWTLVGRPDNSSAQLTGADTAYPSFVADLPGEYEADLVVSDGVANSGHGRVRITATNPDPVAIAQPERNVLLGTTVTLDASASVPPTGGDATLLAYHWTLEERPAASGAALSGEQTPTPTFYVDQVGEYRAELVVSYQGRSSEALTVVITATLANTRPVADAGGPYTVERGQTLTLDGSGSSDADGDTLSYRWYVINPSAASGASPLGIPNGSSLTVLEALVGHDTVSPTLTPDVIGNWGVFLAVYDGTSLSNLVSTSITVTLPEGAENTPPVATWFTTPRLGFVEPKYSDELELSVTAWASGNSYDIDGTWVTRRYQWIEHPPGFEHDLSEATSLGFTPTVAGDYVVEMIVNDGIDDSEPARRRFVARTGANRAPGAEVSVDSGTVLVGDTAWFDARNSSDPDGDALTYQWHLFDRPDGSNATMRFEDVTLENGVVLRNARVGVTTDQPGAYIALLSVADSHGVTNPDWTAIYGRVLAKAENNPPTIGYITGNNDHQANRRTNTHFDDAEQPYIVGGEQLTFYAVNPVDPDLDVLYFLWTLEQPWDSELTDAGDRQNFVLEAPEVPGAYSVTAIVSDGIATSEPHVLRFNAVERDAYPSLLLEDHYSAGSLNYWDRSIRSAGDYSRQRAFPYWDYADPSFPVFVYQVEAGDNVLKNYRLTAYGGDYTIINLKVGESTNFDYPGYTGAFVGLADNQVIAQGESVEFSLVLNAPGGQGTTQTMNNIADGIIFSFEVAEMPGWTFEYRPWVY